MDMITSIRAPVPVAELPMPAAVEPRPQGALGAAAPVVAPDLPQAVQQVTMKSAANDPQLMATRMTAETSAAAAEAARDAYIKASIAAGINPLPVP
jgi:hypothetical protein